MFFVPFCYSSQSETTKMQCAEYANMATLIWTQARRGIYLSWGYYFTLLIYDEVNCLGYVLKSGKSYISSPSFGGGWLLLLFIPLYLDRVSTPLLKLYGFTDIVAETSAAHYCRCISWKFSIWLRVALPLHGRWASTKEVLWSYVCADGQFAQQWNMYKCYNNHQSVWVKV